MYIYANIQFSKERRRQEKSQQEASQQEPGAVKGPGSNE